MTEQITAIEAIIKDFFRIMTYVPTEVSVVVSPITENTKEHHADGVIQANVMLDEPQMLIGQQGKTLFEVQRVLRMVINKKLAKAYYLNVDVNGYKDKKVSYLEALAKETAQEVLSTGVEKQLPLMNAYERRVIHATLTHTAGIATESRGEGFERYIVVKPASSNA